MDVLIPFLFAAATIGHFALVIASHNWWYGQRLHRQVTDLVQVIHGLLFLAGPVLFWVGAGFDLRQVVQSEPASVARASAVGYVLLCWFTGLVALPAVTIARGCRRALPLLSNHVRTLDVAKELGYKPVGDGHFCALAHLPGNEIFQCDLTQREIVLPRLPQAWDGLTILHLSDFHLHGTPDKVYFRQVLDACSQWEPDLIALTGDYVDTVFHHRWLIPLLGRLKSRLGTFAILGNHDVWYEPERVRRRLRRIGCQVVGNTWTQIEVRNHPLIVIGHEGPWFKPAPDLTNCPDDAFRLLLSHTPDNVRWAQRRQIDLMLSGHVHGGQIRLPIFGPVVMPSRYGRRFDCGVFEEKPTILHVTRGVGAKEPIRYRCRPEAVLLLLRPIKSATATPATDEGQERDADFH